MTGGFAWGETCCGCHLSIMGVLLRPRVYSAMLWWSGVLDAWVRAGSARVYDNGMTGSWPKNNAAVEPWIHLGAWLRVVYPGGSTHIFIGWLNWDACRDNTLEAAVGGVKRGLSVCERCQYCHWQRCNSMCLLAHDGHLLTTIRVSPPVSVVDTCP